MSVLELQMCVEDAREALQRHRRRLDRKVGDVNLSEDKELDEVLSNAMDTLVTKDSTPAMRAVWSDQRAVRALKVTLCLHELVLLNYIRARIFYCVRSATS